MSFENLLKTLEEKGKSEESAILETAKTEARKISSEASQKAKQIMDTAKADGQKLGNEARLEIHANSKLKQRKILAQARDVLMLKAIQNIEQLMEDFANGKKYDELLLLLTKDCIKSLGQNALLYCKKE
ncbi:MAG: hypothetical protein V1644_03960, partial [Candidatus Micrarchaeota archaeon]